MIERSNILYPFSIGKDGKTVECKTHEGTVKNVVVGDGIEKIRGLCDDSLGGNALDENGKENPIVICLIDVYGDAHVIGGKGKKILICEAFSLNNYVYAPKASLSKSFDYGDEGLTEFIDKALGENEPYTVVGVDLDGKKSIIKNKTDMGLLDGSFFNCVATPMLMFELNYDVKATICHKSIIVLDLGDKLTCSAVYYIKDKVDSDNGDVDGMSPSVRAVEKGIERYFNDHQ